MVRFESTSGNSTTIQRQLTKNVYCDDLIVLTPDA